jgi:hypothetical protein
MIRNFLFLAFALFIACSGQKQEKETEPISDTDEWAMMDEFHMVMAESFHPYKDSANLAPAIANAEDMAQLADKWSQSELPQKVNNDNVKGLIGDLKTASAAFAETAKSGDTTRISAELTALHDIFHHIQDAWYKGEGHGHSEHH